MQEVVAEQRWSSHLNAIDRDAQLKQTLDHLESENSELKKLVVQLSETIIRNVIGKR
jgi:hypothetical protein